MEGRILAVGDVVGKSGLDYVARKLRSVKKLTGADFTVVNGENACGVGIIPRQAEELLDAGADAVTLGNHAFQKQEIFDMLDDEPRLLRPHNYAPQAPGFGWRVLEAPFGPVLVMNLIGRCGMDFGPDNPFTAADRILRETEGQAKVRLLDFHAEATSEKLAMAWYLDGRLSALWGTHTHVQTGDARVFPQGTGYITDLGMTGPRDSVLGITPEQSVRMFLGYPRDKYTTAPGPVKLEGAVFTVDTDTGRCLEVRPVRLEE
jgi:metallophosphoesterase (TIGR00282 family)